MEAFTNSLGMCMMPIPAGSFQMGVNDSHPIDGPMHSVVLTQPFYMAKTPVTNAQYEQFDPLHRAARAQSPFSPGDDDAAIFISHEDACNFARWLSNKEGRRYLLPTEAQWEYAARAGKNDPYALGENLPEACLRNQRESWWPDVDHHNDADALVRLTVGQTPENEFGLQDMNGLVEEWCADRFTRYSSHPAEDPLGKGMSDFFMTRGGSHSTPTEYLRCDARMGQLAEDRNWVIGVRLICMDMPRIEREYHHQAPAPLWSQDVSQDRVQSEVQHEALFRGPIPFVRLTVDDDAGLHSHNHGPSVVECPNGDLLVAWFSCPRESGREMNILASRLRKGAQEWDKASVFLESPARNLSCTVLMRQGDVLYHLNGFSACATWANVALGVRVSQDNGATWSAFRVVQPRHDHVLMPCAYELTPEGRVLVSADNISVDQSVSGRHGSYLFYMDGNTVDVLPGEIAGIHAPFAHLKDGSILAFGRGNNVNGHMPQSISRDGGRNFQISASIFPGIGMGQRAVLRRLPSGALFFASFADQPFAYDGGVHRATGLYGALSYDEGLHWEKVKAIVPKGVRGVYSGGAWTGSFQMDETHAEPRGYLTCEIGRNGVIHLLSSGLYYAFNQAWLEQ